MTEDGRTYHLETIPGALNAYAQTLLVAGGLGWAVHQVIQGNTTLWKLSILIGCGLILVMFVAPMWLNWLKRVHAETVKQENEARSSSPRSLALRLEIEYEEARRQTAETIRRMDEKQIDLAREMNLTPAIEVHTGARVMWKLDGMLIPVWFALDWYREYQKCEEDILPGQGSFAGYENREQYRTWNKALTAELVRMGVVRSAGGPYPPRWVMNDERSRLEALGRTGLYLALTAAGWEGEE